MLVKLVEGLYIVAEDISGVYINTDNNCIIVDMKIGTCHTIKVHNDKSLYETLDKLVEQLNYGQ